MRSIATLSCLVVLGTSLGSVQEPRDIHDAAGNAGQTALEASAAIAAAHAGLAPTSAVDRVSPADGLIGQRVVNATDRNRGPGDQCPTGYLCGQNQDVSGLIWLYSDLGFSLGGGTGLVTAESFPPPGEPNLTVAIGVVTWHGAYADNTGSGCTKANQFGIKFYRTDPNKPGYPVVNPPICTYADIVPVSAVKVGEINFGGAQPADEYQFTALLPTPCTLARGQFSIAASNVQPGCYHVIGPAATGQGDSFCVGWWQTPFTWTTTGVDIGYCFGQKIPGACCNDQTEVCDPNSSEFTCLVLGGRFAPSPATCETMDPACGQVLGACCRDDGTCALTTYVECVGEGACCLGTSCAVKSPAACLAAGGTYVGSSTVCTPSPCCIGCVACRGDTNCDGQISYSDINPFVLGIADLSTWQAQNPTCYWRNLDINEDDAVSYADINPFVQKIASPGPCPATLTGPDKTQGHEWLGPDTLCTACCSIYVDPNAPNENEPNDCGVDTFNAGCNVSPAVFSALPLNTWFFGESGTFGAGLRDTDWYTLTLAAGQNHILKVEFQAEFDVTVDFIRSGDCDANLPTGYGVLHSATAVKCADPNTTAFTTRCLPPGTYWVVISPQAFTGVPCRADYAVKVTDTAGCTLCSITCPSYGNVHNELEACGADTNGGCDADPSAFEFVGTNWSGTICGHTYASGNRHDVDCYSFKLTVASRMMWSVSTEVPVRATTVFQQVGADNLPPACGATNFYWSSTLFASCSAGSSTEGLYKPDPNDPNRLFWFLVVPEDASGPLFGGYPCGTWGTNENEYSITWTTTPTVCTTICSDFGWIAGQDPSEGEPVCSIGYVDVYNGGCDRGDPNKMLTLADGVPICAEGGVYLKSGQYTPDYDWYRFTIPTGTGNHGILIETAGEFAYDVDLYQSAAACANMVLLERYAVTPCAMKSFVSSSHPPGTYWIRVYAVGTDVTCGKKYVIQATTTTPSP